MDYLDDTLRSAPNPTEIEVQIGPQRLAEAQIHIPHGINTRPQLSERRARVIASGLASRNHIAFNVTFRVTASPRIT